MMKTFAMQTSFPPVAVELSDGYATAVRVQRKGGHTRLLEWHRVELPERPAADDGPGGALILNEFLRPALEELAGKLGRVRRLSLAVPDTAVRSFFLEVENPGATGKELHDMISFKIKKLTPVNLEGAALAYQRLRPRDGGGWHFLAILTSRRMTEGYERFFSARGTHLGLIETASLAAINLFEPVLEEVRVDGDFAFLRVARSHFHVSLFRDGCLTFSRARITPPGPERAQLIEHELRTLNLFAQDRLGSRGISTVLVLGPEADAAATAPLFEAGFKVRALKLEEVVEVPPRLRDRPEEQRTLIAAVGSAARR